MKKLTLTNKYIIGILIISYAIVILLITQALYIKYVTYDNLPPLKPKIIKKWAISQITNDLKGKEIKLSYPEFDEYIKKNKPPIGKIIIKNGKVSSEIEIAEDSSDFINKMTPHNAWRLNHYLYKINNLIKKGAQISDVTFYLLSWDAPNKTITTLFKKIKESPPLFVFAANKHDPLRHKFILTPDDYTIANMKLGYWAGWNSISKKVISANKNSLWQNKINKLMWRGKTRPPSEFSRREKLKAISQSHTDLMDVKYTGGGGETYETLAIEFSLDNYLNKKDQINYKILLNLDGYTCTYPGLLWRLLSNSATIKQNSNNIQWFYSALKPWVHYIPIKNDLRDLVEKVNWIRNNDLKAKEIADNSTKFVKENLMLEDIDSYIVKLLNEYAKLQQKPL